MVAPSLPGWNLANMRQKYRLVTGTPGSDQLTDAQVNTYLNNYYIFKMPFELKEQITNQFLSFKTVPGQDVYQFPGGYFTDQPGAYADGFPLVFYQDPDLFFQDWPQQYAVNNIATGNGSQTNFTGGLQSPPIVIGSLFISDGNQVLQDQGIQQIDQTVATGNGGMTYSGTLSTFPIRPGSLQITDGRETLADQSNGTLIGNLGGTGTINYTTGVWAVSFGSNVATGTDINAVYSLPGTVGILSGNGFGTINYVTGAYNFTFSQAPPSSATIYAKYIGYQGNRPQGCLFFQNTFTLRPVPDQTYQILMQGYIMPKFLIYDTDTPLQNEWGDLIVYGAALDTFSDRGDLDNYQRYYDIFKRSENIALGRTIQQYTAEQSVPRF